MVADRMETPSWTQGGFGLSFLEDVSRSQRIRVEQYSLRDACRLVDWEKRRKCRIVEGLGGASGRRNASVGCMMDISIDLLVN